MKSPQAFSADDFMPVTQTDRKESGQLHQPEAYWQQAYLRFRSNRKSLLAFFMIILLLLFSFAGPLLWPVDPGRQDLTQSSQAPGAAKKSLLIPSLTPWVKPGETGEALKPEFWRDASIRFDGSPHTESVRLLWPKRKDTAIYKVYRHILPPSGADDLGLPLGEVHASHGLFFEDKLRLRAGTYYYSIAAIEEDTVPAVLTTQVDVTQAITVEAARQLELLSDNRLSSELDENSFIYLPYHPLGTDYLGRDMLARLMAGGRTSLFIGITAPLLFVLIGLVYGSISGYAKPWLDNTMMGFADFVIALPFLLFMILFKVVFGIGPGENGVFTMLFAMVVLSWPTTARLVRGQVMLLRTMPYIESAKMMGAGASYLIGRHMLPNLIGVAMVTLSFAIPVAIFTEAFLSFIGMGVVPPTPSWGSMCNDGIKTLFTYPHELLFPAFFISITVLCFNLLGDGLRDALDIQESR